MDEEKKLARADASSPPPEILAHYVDLLGASAHLLMVARKA
jgi:hypothetical protein